MGIRQYNLGKKHGRLNQRYMWHRNARRYDSQSANESYANGYRDGQAERNKEKKAPSFYDDWVNR